MDIRRLRTTAAILTAVVAQWSCATEPPTKPPLGNIDGTYVGTWTSDRPGEEDTGALTFTVANGVLTGTASPGRISSGTVSAAGEIAGSGIFNGHLYCEGGTLTVTYEGQVALSSSGVATASGTFTDPTTAPPNCVGSSGTWTATRQ
jgi:hypothetical protein